MKKWKIASLALLLCLGSYQGSTEEKVELSNTKTENIEKRVLELQKKARVARIKARRSEREADRIQFIDLSQYRKLRQEERAHREDCKAFAREAEQLHLKKQRMLHRLEKDAESTSSN
jgi:hypothetical protein